MAPKPVKILTPVGMMGYGYETGRLYQGLNMGADAIILDAGSTDSGPQKLALGEGTCPREAHVRDFGPILDACFHHKKKVIISSAGGDGSNSHVDMFVDIIDTYCKEKGYSLKLARIYASIDKATVHKALKAGVITPCGAVPELTADEVDSAVEIVAQMGMEPFLKVFKEIPDYDILIAGRTYDPAPYAAFSVANGVSDLGLAFHMGKVMECGAQCGWPKSKEALATITSEKFDILPLQPGSKCSTQSLAAHSLYENARTDLHPGPGGLLDLTTATYFTSGERSAGAAGASFHVSDPYTVKLEGAKILGYRSMWQGSFRDPVLISQIDDFMERCQKHVELKFKDAKFEMAFKIYGKNGTMGPMEPDPSVGKEIFLLGEIQADDQILATQIANSARVFCVHAPYTGQLSTTGNFAMPITPLEIPLGPVTAFNIYHLLPVEDPTALFPISELMVGPPSSTVERQPEFGYDLIPEDAFVNDTAALTNGHSHGAEEDSKQTNGDILAPVLSGKSHPLNTLAKDIRSKNAGPYEVTFDIIFNDLASFQYARESPLLTPKALAPLWNAREEDVITCQFSEPARAFKFTLPRPWRAGAFGERDIHCSQQHVPLLNLVL